MHLGLDGSRGESLAHDTTMLPLDLANELTSSAFYGVLQGCPAYTDLHVSR